MTAVTTRPRPPRAGRATTALTVALAAAALAVPLVVATGLRLPSHIETLSVDNPHDWIVSIAVADGSGDGRQLLGRVARESERTFSEVVDQGDDWTFLFTYADAAVAIRVDRDALEAADWSVQVPETIADRLRAAGVPETPAGSS